MGRGRRPRRAEYGRVAGCSPRSAPCRAGEARAFVQAVRRTCAAGAPRAHLRRRRGDRGSRQGRAPQKRYHPHPPVPRQSPRLRVPREGSRAASVYWGCFKITAAQALTASSPSRPPPPGGTVPARVNTPAASLQVICLGQSGKGAGRAA